MNAFESVRQRVVPIDVHMPVEKVAPRKVALPNELLASRKWRSGGAPHVGWWKARQGMGATGWRWWNGSVWSLPASPAKTASEAEALAQFHADRSASIAWCMDWPEGARVQRINPETGEVTGGAA